MKDEVFRIVLHWSLVLNMSFGDILFLIIRFLGEIMEESSLTFLSGTGVPVGVNILALACNGFSFGIHLPDKEKKSRLPCTVTRY